MSGKKMIRQKTTIFGIICSFLLMTPSQGSSQEEKEESHCSKNHTLRNTSAQIIPVSYIQPPRKKTPISAGFLQELMSSDPVLIDPVSKDHQTDEEPSKTSLVMSKTSSCKSESRERFVSQKPKQQIFSQGTPRSEQLKKINQERVETKTVKTDQENGSPSSHVFGNMAKSSAGSSPRKRSRKIHSPNSFLNVQDEPSDPVETKDRNQEFSSSSPRIFMDSPGRTRKTSEGKKTEAQEPFIIPIEVNFPSNTMMILPQIVLNMPEISVPTSIVISFHFPVSGTQEKIALQKKLTRKRRVSSSKESAHSLGKEGVNVLKEGTQFLFDEEVDGFTQDKGPFSLNAVSPTSPVGFGKTASLWEGSILDQILLHTQKHSLLFSKEGLEKMSLCIKSVNNFVDLQMLLRGDNQYLFESFKFLYDDYSALAQISASETQERQKTDLLIGISNCHNKVCVSANKDEKSRYQDQHDAMDIMFCEFVELFANTTENFPKTEKMNPKLIRANAELISMTNEFFNINLSFLIGIEKERSDFLHILNTFSGNIKREIKVDEALEGFPNLIERHKEAALRREELSFSNMVSSVGEIKESFSEKMLTLRKSETPPSTHESSSEEGKKKRKITPRRLEKDVSSQKK